MRINEYKSLSEFCLGVDENTKKHMGIEFIYNQVYYRMCRDQLRTVSYQR